MKRQRYPSVPIITNDPYFSIWSPCDRLYDEPVCSWTGAKKPVTGILEVDGKPYRFMGVSEITDTLEQTGLEVSPTSTYYRFEGAGVALGVTFTSPLLLDDLDLMSSPFTYIDFELKSTDGATHDTTLAVSFDEAVTYDGAHRQEVLGGTHKLGNCKSVFMGKKKQSPLNHSGDMITIDWGYLHLAVMHGAGEVSFDRGGRTAASARFDLAAGPDIQKRFLVAAYDDIASIMYFGDALKGYWAREGKTILDIIDDAVKSHDRITERCKAFDESLMKRALALGGEDYLQICCAAYRQAIAAHKLIADKEGNLVFLSKECNSDGCIGTVDVSYPSVPLFLLYAPGLVMGMMRPVLDFALMPVWEYDFAPHDLGIYPYACGQVYGVLKPDDSNMENGPVHPMYYQYPRGSDLYLHRKQMPVEECGNMLIMAAGVALAKGTAEDFLPYMELFDKWVGYLVKYGADPGEQLCTDDFAGHLAHNVNLSAKAIMGIEAYSIVQRFLGNRDSSRAYHEKASRMAADWEDKASIDGRTALTFEPKAGWSLKYNTVWDIVFGSGLFSRKVFDNEVEWYLKMMNKFGTPLDNRADYTKTDWILWASIMTNNKSKFEALIKPVAQFLRESADRVPFSDLYFTSTGIHRYFQNRTVQGGVFMPMLKESGLLKNAFYDER